MIRALNKPRHGMTLVEVLIALFICSIVSIGLYGSAIYTMKQTAKNVEHIFAVQLASSAAAKVRTARYARLAADPSTLSTNDFEKQFATPQVISLDPLNPKSTTFTLSYKMTGFGRGAEKINGGGQVKIDMTIPNHGDDWANNQYKDHFLVVTGGAGANQVMYIKGNKASRVVSGQKKVEVRLTKNFDGSGDSDWAVDPGSSSVLAVDYGLYCDVQVTWGNGTGYRNVKETVYVPNN